MTLPNIDDLTPDQLRILLSRASSRLEQIARDESDTETQLRNDVADTLTDLDALIGDGDPKGTGSLVAVRQYTGPEMAAAAQVALPLAFHGLEILARATRDIARVVGTTA